MPHPVSLAATHLKTLAAAWAGITISERSAFHTWFLC